MILITGAAGFIGSAFVAHLNELGHTDLVLVDDFSHKDRKPNWINKQYQETWHRDDLMSKLASLNQQPKVIFHIGARTDTTEKDWAIFERLNVSYSQVLWNWCSQKGIPLIYASSAATYGAGEHGYQDRHDIINQLSPLNPYGRSKNDFDIWALAQAQQPPHWYGLKFFNVYGPNEYHKGRMASVILHTSRQIKATGAMKLFRSHRSDFADGQQSRDFVYVKDLVKVMWWLYEHYPSNGLYNLGTGQARSFMDLASLTFQALGLSPDISFIDTPADIRDTYQYFTEADMSKLRQAGYHAPFYSLEEGIADYVGHYLKDGKYW